MADKIVCEFNLKVMGFCVHPLDHSENSYPWAADAPIDTSVPGGRNVPRLGLSCTLWYLKNLDGLVKLKLIHPPLPALILIPINPSSSAISKTSFCETEVSDDSKRIGQNSEPVILPLFGRPTYNGSNKWSYYTSTDKMNQIKIPISNKKCEPQLSSKKNLSKLIKKNKVINSRNILNFLQYCDGKNDLELIAKNINLKLSDTKKIFKTCKSYNLIRI